MSGRSWSQILAVGGALVLALQAVAACNSVLSIEPAELGDISQGEQDSCWPPPPGPQTECTQDESCATKCRDEIDACLHDDACVNELWIYRTCLGPACSDDQNHCAGCTSKNSLANSAAKCVAGCAGSQNLATALTLCDGYCSCMDFRCSSNEPGGSRGACVTACLMGQPGLALPAPPRAADPSVAALWANPIPPAMAFCFWQHCERVDPKFPETVTLHCDHAIGVNQPSVCPAKQPTSQTKCPFPKAYGNSACNTGADCCSNICDPSSKLCIGP